ncbi:hypothetical protein [Aquabacterium sp.]|uniref:hypothetical protein n=1 Tax=Aquabacterium sp. TaxID=1872578 RepID=UPI002C9BCCDC|nr:hypothetical protein [Aquabacterium sp.]HSW03945.1 hypothetical protein [Aquabacterium sp.]
MNESHRNSTPPEALFDLTTVVAVAAAAARLHHGLAESSVAEAALEFVQSFFAIWWPLLPVLLVCCVAIAAVAYGLSPAWGLLMLAAGPGLLIAWVVRDRRLKPERFAVR